VKPDMSFSDAMRAIGIFAFAFTGQFILVEVISEMEDKEEFPKAYTWISAPFQFFAFAACGMGGYYFKGDAIAGIIIDGIGFGPTLRLAAACLLAHMLITYLIKGVVFCRNVHRSLEGAMADEKTARAWAIWLTVVTGTMVASWLTGNIVPFFSDLVDLLGASLTPFCCWIVPIVLYVYSAWDSKGLSAAELALLAVEVGLSVVLMVAGTAITIANIIKAN